MKHAHDNESSYKVWCYLNSTCQTKISTALNEYIYWCFQFQQQQNACFSQNTSFVYLR